MGALLAVRIDCCCKQGQQHDQVGHSSLHFAAATGSLGEVKHFVENLRCDAKQSDSLGKTPLFHAARQGKLDVVRYLIEECRMNANQKDESGGTVLFEAAAGGNLEVVEYLVESGNVDPIRENHDGYTAHDWAVNEEIADYLQDVIEAKGHTIKRPFDDSFDDMFDEQPLHKAVLAGDLKMVMHIVKSKGRGGVKSAHNNVRKAAVAIDRGKRGVGGLSSSIIEQEDDLGRTALFYASDLAMVRYLVEECKADVNHKSSKGETALFDAAGDGNLPIVR